MFCDVEPKRKALAAAYAELAATWRSSTKSKPKSRSVDLLFMIHNHRDFFFSLGESHCGSV